MTESLPKQLRVGGGVVTALVVVKGVKQPEALKILKFKVHCIKK